MISKPCQFWYHRFRVATTFVIGQLYLYQRSSAFIFYTVNKYICMYVHSHKFNIWEELKINNGIGNHFSTCMLISQMEPHMRKRSASVDSDSGGSPWTFEKGTGLSPPSPQEGKILDELPPPKCLSPLTRHHLLKKPNPRTTIIPRLPSH